jgi:hypothetical protein
MLSHTINGKFCFTDSSDIIVKLDMIIEAAELSAQCFYYGVGASYRY